MDFITDLHKEMLAAQQVKPTAYEVPESVRREQQKWIEINSKPIEALTDEELRLTQFWSVSRASDGRIAQAKAESDRRCEEHQARVWEEQRPQRLAAARAKFCEFAPPGLLPKAEQQLIAVHDSQVNAIAKVNEWWTDPTKPVLIMYGPPGTGKTHVAARVFWHGLSVQDYRYTDSCEFREEVQIINRWRAAAARHKSYRGDRLARAGLLVVDDFGQHEHNVKSHELFYGILNHRYTHNLKTVITTNLEPPKLMQVIGSKLVSRLFDRQKRVLVKMDGPDLRITGVPRAMAA